MYALWNCPSKVKETFSDKQKLRELVSKPVLEEMLNEVLQQDLHKERKNNEV